MAFRPSVTPTTEEAYEALGPLTSQDEELGWPLLLYMDSLVRQLDDVEQLSRDSDTHVGWGRLLDLAAAPDNALEWLAQFVGVVPLQGLDPASQRIRIGEAAGWHRGSPDAIKGAARQFLTGTRRVDLVERDGSAYRFRIRTYRGETPDPTKVQEAVTALKPAGVFFTYEIVDGPTVDELTGTIDEQTPTIDGYGNTVPAGG